MADITIQKNNFNDALGFSLREYLRVELNDPESGNREAGDKFVWFSSPEAVLDKKNHKLPFISLKLEDGSGEDLGHDNPGGMRRANLIMRVVCDGPSNKELLDQAMNFVLGISEDEGAGSDTGSGPDYNYDLTDLYDTSHTTGPRDRDEFSDHPHDERTAEVELKAILMG